MVNSWKLIWSSKNPSDFALDQESKSFLIRLNGFDSGPGEYTVQDWDKMVIDVIKRAGVSSGIKILDVGCGCGAWLYSAQTLLELDIYGFDYSPTLIDIAKKVLPNGNFKVGEIKDILTIFPDVKFDFIVCHSVIQYLDDFDSVQLYIRDATSLLKPNGVHALLDINDKLAEKNYHAERSLSSSSEEYYSKFSTGLKHLFIDKEALINYLWDIKYKSLLSFPHAASSYINSKFRFNLLAFK